MPQASSKLAPAILVSGTNTDVGKTFFTALFTRYLTKAHVPAVVIKIVQTGCASSQINDEEMYAQAVRDLSGEALSPQVQTLVKLGYPSSPHHAAKLDNCNLETEVLADVIASLRQSNNTKIMIFEGSGGLMTPVNRQETLLDLFRLLNLPLILVAMNRLGVLNEILLTINAASQANILGLVLNHPPVIADEIICKDNELFLRDKFPNLPQLLLPWYSPKEKGGWDFLEKLAQPFFEKIISRILPFSAKEDLLKRDTRSVWHPYASVTIPPLITEAELTYKNRIILPNGQKLIDGMSSWWAAIHGYNHPHLVSAMKFQLEKMPHIMFGGITHEPGVRLAERLLAHMPKGLEYVFFADSGSIAVEVALKMALQYQKGMGRTKKIRFLTPRGGYHGDSMGAMSVCDPVTGMHNMFSGILPEQIFMPRPSCRFDKEFSSGSMLEAEQIIAERHEEIAAVILEPIVQGAGGMWFYHPDYLSHLSRLCKKYEILLIFDEIATGFGRTGKFFAAEWAGVSPDILCCGKALTGGCLTLAATACSREIAAGICQDGHVLMHGPTFMANPLACAAANASLDILGQGDWPLQVNNIEQTLKKLLAPLKNSADVRDVRILGAIGVVEMQEAVSLRKLQKFFVQNGVWIRPFSNLIYIMPPYITPEEDLFTLCSVIKKAVEAGIWKNS